MSARHEEIVDWNEDRVAVLRALWNEGKSAGQIAGYMGRPATRNSVMGKLFRIGLLGKRRVASGIATAQPFRMPPTPPRRFSWEQHA